MMFVAVWLGSRADPVNKDVNCFCCISSLGRRAFVLHVLVVNPQQEGWAGQAVVHNHWGPVEAGLRYPCNILQVVAACILLDTTNVHRSNRLVTIIVIVVCIPTTIEQLRAQQIISDKYLLDATCKCCYRIPYIGISVVKPRQTRPSQQSICCSTTP